MMKLKICLVMILLFAGIVAPTTAVPSSDNANTIVSVAASGFISPFSPNHAVQYMEGRFWVFYWVSGTGFVYKSSLNGVDWSAQTLITANVYDSASAGVYYNGTIFTYVTTRYTTDNSMYYRAGTPNADGTITWLAAEQTVKGNEAGKPVSNNIQITADTSGYAWIACRYKSDGVTVTQWVWKNSVTNGSWINAAGFPYQDYTSSNGYISLCPLPGDKMAAFDWSFLQTGGFRLYNAGWSARTTPITGYPDGQKTGDTVSVGEEFYLASGNIYATAASQIMRYHGVWDGALGAGVGGVINQQSLTKLGNDTVCLVWETTVGTSHYIYTRSSDFALNTDWLLAEVVNQGYIGTSTGNPTASPDNSSGYVGVAFNGAGVMFVYFDPTPVAEVSGGGSGAVIVILMVIAVFVIMVIRRR